MIKSIIGLLLVSTVVHAGKNIFDDDSDFIRGFETGIMMRNQDSKVEDFGCVVPDEKKNKYTPILQSIQLATKAIKPFLANDVALENAYMMLQEFLSGIGYLILVVDPESGSYLDEYCRGMIFGKQSSRMLARIASALRSHGSLDLENVLAKDSKLKEKSKGFKNLSFFEKLKVVGGQIYSEVKEQMKNDPWVNPPGKEEL